MTCYSRQGGLGVGWDAVAYQFTSARGRIGKRGRGSKVLVVSMRH